MPDRPDSLSARIHAYEQSLPAHRAGTVDTAVLEAIERLAPSSIEWSMETGCGKTTILLSNLSARHHVFAFDDRAESQSSVAYYEQCPLFRPDRTATIFGATQLTVPGFGFAEPIDLALLDGPHGYPFPELEYYYVYPHLRPGALLIIDDIHIPTIHRLHTFLADDDMFRLVHIERTTSFFVRTEAPAFYPLGDGWEHQRFNKSRFPAYPPPPESQAGDYSQLQRDVERLQKELRDARQGIVFAPPGHFYSPLPSIAEVERDSSRLFERVPREMPGIDLREAEQLALLQRFVAYYDEMPFQPHKVDGLRYYFENPAYSYSDAICLHGMIRELRPQRIIEVGSGYSSCMTLDTNERCLGGSAELTFIEPYPALLESLMAPGDRERVRILPVPLQDVDLREFDALAAHDILFVDSTHVGKIGSDVNRLLFEILPRLAPGVHIHLHDIFYPFEYPREWLLEGRAWNEAYLLRAFLAFSTSYQVVLMNTFMERYHEDFFKAHLSLCLRNPGGSIWLRRI